MCKQAYVQYKFNYLNVTKDMEEFHICDSVWLQRLLEMKTDGGHDLVLGSWGLSVENWKMWMYMHIYTKIETSTMAAVFNSYKSATPMTLGKVY